MSNEYLIGSVTLSNPLNTALYAAYQVYGLAELDIGAAITIKEANDLTAQIGVMVSESPESTWRVDVRNISELPSDMLVKQAAQVELAAGLTVTPKNKMYGNYEIIEPIPFIHKAMPQKDTYIRSLRPRVNYGREDSLIVGNNFGDEFRSLIKYDLSGLPKNVDYNRATIVLNGVDFSYNFDVSVYATMTEWDEYSTTWVNAPVRGRYISSFKSGNSTKQVRVDITDLFNRWVSGEIDNNGLYFIKQVISEIGTRTYSSNESSVSHYLEIEYFDVNMFSYNMTYSRWGLTVNPFYDLNSAIAVKPTEWETDIAANVHVVDGTKMPSSVVVSRPNLVGEIDVKYAGRDNWRGEISVAAFKTDDSLKGSVGARVTATKDLKSLLITKNADDAALLDTVVGVARLVNSDRRSSLTVTQPYDLASTVNIYPEKPKGASTLQSMLRVKASGFSDLKTGINVVKSYDTTTKFEVGQYESFNASLGVRQEATGDLRTQMKVEYAARLPGAMLIRQDDTMSRVGVSRAVQNDTASAIFIRWDGQQNIASKAVVRGSGVADILPTVITPRPTARASLPAGLTVVQLHDTVLTSELFVKFAMDSDTPSLVGIRVNGELDMSSSVTPRLSAFRDTYGSLYVRAGDVADLDMAIDVGELPFKGYAYIM